MLALVLILVISALFAFLGPFEQKLGAFLAAAFGMSFILFCVLGITGRIKVKPPKEEPKAKPQNNNTYYPVPDSYEKPKDDDIDEVEDLIMMNSAWNFVKKDLFGDDDKKR